MLRKQKIEMRKDLRVKERMNREISDWLAMERTLYANERTFLAYVRTSLAFVIAGFTMIKIFDEFVFNIFGVVLIAIGLVIALFGIRKHYRKQDQIVNYKHAYTPTSPAHADILEDEKHHNSGT